MGAWGTGLYSNDTAEDIRDDCRDVFSVKTPEEGLRILEEEYLKEIQEDDYDELADFWYAVSDYQWNKGILTERAKKKALELLERGAGLELWIEEGNKSDIKKRKEVLEKLKEKLNSPQPPKKKIRDSGIHYAIKKGDIIAVRPNEKFTIEFDYKEKQEWINVPYFTAEYLEKEMYERFSEEDKDEEEKRIRYEITYAEGYKPIINKESYMFFLCIEKERIPSGRLVKEVYDEKLTFVQYAYYGSELTNVIYIEEENPVEVILRNGKFCAAIGQRLIYKAKGELILSIEGNVELYGSSATFGPSSFGSFPCVEAEVVSIHIEKESKLSMQGGRTFEAVIKGTNNRTNVISSPSIVFYN